MTAAIEHAPLASAGSVSARVNDGMADICFGHPKGNSLPASVLRALASEITYAGERGDVRVILLRSYGTGPFCAGASFDELSAIRDATANRSCTNCNEPSGICRSGRDADR